MLYRTTLTNASTVEALSSAAITISANTGSSLATPPSALPLTDSHDSPRMTTKVCTRDDGIMNIFPVRREAGHASDAPLISGRLFRDDLVSYNGFPPQQPLT